MGWNIAFTLMHYGNEWRRQRRMMHRYFNIHVVKMFQPKETQAVHELLHRLAEEPEDFMKNIRL